MQAPEEFARASSISFAVLTSVCAAFAAFAYMLYGDATKTLILDNVTGSALGDAVKVLLCVDLIFTLPIIMTAPRELLEAALLPHAEHPVKAAADTHLALKQTGIRVALVAFIYALAMLVPSLGDLVNLVGGVCSPLMGFILPPLFYLALERPNLSAASTCAHTAIIVFGCVAMVVSLYMTIDGILHPPPSN